MYVQAETSEKISWSLLQGKKAIKHLTILQLVSWTARKAQQ